MGLHAVASIGSDLSAFQVARLVARHCVNYTAVLMAIVKYQLVYRNTALTSASTRVQLPSPGIKDTLHPTSIEY